MDFDTLRLVETFSEQDLAGVLKREDLEGFNPITRRASAVQKMRLAEAAKMWADFREGRIDPYLMTQAFQPTQEFAFKELCHRYPAAFRETMTVSDFAALTDQVLDRMLLDNYQVAPVTWPSLTRVKKVKDFRAGRMYMRDGGKGVLAQVNELEGFDRRTFSMSSVDTNIAKYAGGAAVSWEAVINDDLGIFTDIPRDLAIAAARTKDLAVTQLYVDASGPHATLYSAGNQNIINATYSGDPFTGINPALSITALQQAFVVLANQVDADGFPIVIDAVYLVVPPAMEVTARNILNSTELRITSTAVGGGAVTGVEHIVQNWMRNKTTLLVNPLIPYVASSNGNTSWFLFASPNSGRPCLVVTELTGYEQPILYRKAPNAMRLGGGLDVAHGDFERMSTDYKILTLFGTLRVEPKMTVASNGSGS
jgi:hypothetical protein